MIQMDTIRSEKELGAPYQGITNVTTDKKSVLQYAFVTAYPVGCVA